MKRQHTKAIPANQSHAKGNRHIELLENESLNSSIAASSILAQGTALYQQIYFTKSLPIGWLFPILRQIAIFAPNNFQAYDDVIKMPFCPHSAPIQPEIGFIPILLCGSAEYGKNYRRRSFLWACTHKGTYFQI